MFVLVAAGSEPFDYASENLVTLVVFGDMYLSLPVGERRIDYAPAHGLTHYNCLVLHDGIGPEPQPHDSGRVEAPAASRVAGNRIKPPSLYIPLAHSRPTKLDTLFLKQLRQVLYDLFGFADNSVDDRLGEGTAVAYKLIREHIPFLAEDTVLAPHIETARRLVAEGTIKRAVEAQLADE